MKIENYLTGVELSNSLSVSELDDDGSVEFRADCSGLGVTASVSVTASAAEVSQLIDMLIWIYNQAVDRGAVDTDKYPDPFC